VTGFPPVNFGLIRPFRSRVKSRHATDRQTDRRTDGQTDTAHHFIMPSTYGDRGHNNTICVVCKDEGNHVQQLSIQDTHLLPVRKHPSCLTDSVARADWCSLVVGLPISVDVVEALERFYPAP